MAFNNLTSRTNVQATIPEEVSDAILTNLTTMCASLSLFKKIPMSTNVTRMPVLSALPTAYFVNGDTGQKQTTELAWSNRYLMVEEMAVIMPVAESVYDDMTFDLWGAAQPLIEDAVGRALDAAIFFGAGKPTSWPDAIAVAAKAKGNTVTRGTAPQAQGGIAEDFNQLLAKVETAGYAVNGFVLPNTYKRYLRGARDTMGQKLLDINTNTIEGSPLNYAMPGLWPAGLGAAEVIAGDFSQGILGTRKDMTWKKLDQAVIQDGTGAIIYNLAQQDMIAIRLTFRIAFQVANTINYQQQTEATRYPFAVLQSP